MNRNSEAAPKDRNVERNHHASADLEDAISKFQTTKRLAPTDRRQIAENLGRLFRDVKARDDDYSYTRLFGDAFPSLATRESKLKKRKQHLVLPGETFNADQLVSRPYDYETLLTPLMHALMPEKLEAEHRRAGYLRLLEGTAFLRQGGFQERFRQEQADEIQTQLRRVIDRVRQAVDLDWMAAWCRTHSLQVLGGAGTPFELGAYGDWFNQSRASLDLDRPVRNAIAPCVNLGTIEIPITLGPLEWRRGFACLDITCDDPTDSGLRRAFFDAIGFETPQDDDGLRVDDAIMECFGSHAEYDSSLSLITRLDLEIRFDTQLAEWAPVVLWRPFDMTLNAFQDAGALISQLRCTNPPRNLCTLTLETMSVDFYVIPLYADEFKVVCMTTDEYGHLHIVTDVDTPLFGMSRQVSFTPPEPEFYTLMLESFSDDSDDEYDNALSPLTLTLNPEWAVEEALEDSRDAFVPAPFSSIAAHVLKNLAYQPGVNRLDQLLIEDAKRKYAMLRDYAEQAESEYRASIDENLGAE